MTQASVYVSPPADGSKPFFKYNDITYTCQIGKTILVPYQAAQLAEANGWVICAAVVSAVAAGAALTSNDIPVTASRNALLTDVGLIMSSNGGSATVITVQNDAQGWVGNALLTLLQYGTGAASFAAGPGVTFRKSAPTPSQYLVTKLMRIGVNEWAYV